MKEADRFKSDGEAVWHEVGALTPARIPAEYRLASTKLAMAIAPGGATKQQSDQRLSEACWWAHKPKHLWVLGNREKYYKDMAEVVKLLYKSAPAARLPALYFEHFQKHTGTQGISLVNLLLRYPTVQALLFSTAHFHNRRFLATFLQQWCRGGDERRLYLGLVDSPDPEVVSEGVDTNQTVEGEIERLNKFMGDDVPELEFIEKVVEQGYIQNS